ncbi:hypothetical protein DFQ27_008874 [Actinomortierella ambigua]|uniref:Poly(A) RNA polymerase mitochondrial-like central palm domain-containing protein n=1 Tax=Actinomortierella ambigua TaxID=1343610 RepID=A0A9P6QF83_9FUNG|nr:hypothetical protein DFQ27_008874 [Actinomortierella ambigua]
MANKKSGRNSSRNPAPPAANAPPTTAASTSATASAPKNASVASSDLDNNMREKLGITPSMVIHSSTDLHLTFIEALYDCIVYELALKKGLHLKHRDVAVRYAQIQMAFAYAISPLIGWRDDLYYSIIISRMHNSPAAVEAFAKTASPIRVKGLYPYNRQIYMKTQLIELGYDYEHVNGYVAVDSLIERSEYIASEGEEDARSLTSDQHVGYFALPRLSKDHQLVFHQRYIAMVPKEYHDPIAVIVLALRRIWGSTGTNATTKEGKTRLVKRDRFGVEEYTEDWTRKYAEKHRIKPAPPPLQQSQKSTAPPVLHELHELEMANGSLHHHTKVLQARSDQLPSSTATTTATAASKEKRDSQPSPSSPSPLSAAPTEKKDLRPQTATSALEKKTGLPSSQGIASAGGSGAPTLPLTATSSLHAKSDTQPSTPTPVSKQSIGSQSPKQPSNPQPSSVTPRQRNDTQPTAVASKETSEVKPVASATSTENNTLQRAAPTSKSSSNSLSSTTASSSDASSLLRPSTPPTPKDKHDPQAPATPLSAKAKGAVLQPSPSPSSGKSNTPPSVLAASKQTDDSQATKSVFNSSVITPPSMSGSTGTAVAPSPQNTTKQMSATQARPTASDSSLATGQASAAKQSQQSTSSSNGASQSPMQSAPPKDKAIPKVAQSISKDRPDTQQSLVSAPKAKGETLSPAAPLGSASNASTSLLKASGQAADAKAVPAMLTSKGLGLTSQATTGATLATATATTATTATAATTTTTPATATTVTTTTTASTASIATTATIAKTAATLATFYPERKVATPRKLAPTLNKMVDEASPDSAPTFYCDLELADFNGPNPHLQLCQPKVDGLSRVQFYQDLSDQANLAYESVLPDAKTVANHAELLLLLQRALGEIYPGPQSNVLSFGSYCNGLLMNDSDADFCIAGDSRANEPPLADMMILGLYLEDMGMEEIQVVDQATVPIVKFVDPHTKLKGDINYGNRLGVVNSEMIKMYTEIDIRCKKLLYLVKLLCRRQGINDSSKGTLSSYALNMMGITFLQNQVPPILPRLQAQSSSTTATTKSVEYYQRGREGRMIWRSVSCTYDTDLERYRDFGKANRKSIGRLLLEFFEFFSRYYDYTGWEVSPALGVFAIQHYRGPHHSGWASTSATATTPSSTPTSTTARVGSPGSNTGASTFNNYNNGNSSNNYNFGYGSRASAGIFRVVDPFLPQRNLVGTCRGENIELVWRTFDTIYKSLSKGDLYGVL